jgi:serine protease Do
LSLVGSVALSLNAQAMADEVANGTPPAAAAEQADREGAPAAAQGSANSDDPGANNQSAPSPDEKADDKKAGKEQTDEDNQPQEKQPEEQPRDEESGDEESGDEKPAADESAAEKPAPEPIVVPCDDDTAKALAKRYPENLQELRLIEKQVQRVREAATPSTVSIQIGGAFGSGVIVSPDGLVLTAGHVCGQPGRRAVFIFPDGRRVRGETLGVNRKIDSGMAKITEPGPWPYMKMAEAADIESGQWVVAIGQPGGFDGERTPPVRLGRVLFANSDVINTDCTLVGGDSGGPLFNMRGEVVGIHSRIGRSITNNFHVPISTYHETRDRLVAAEIWGGRLGSSEPVRQRPLLGVSGNDLNGRAEITQVFENMPAARAGIKVGDVVQTLNGEQVESFAEFANRVMSSKPGAQIKIGLLRDEKPVEIEVRLAMTPQPLPGAPDVEPPSEEQEG